MVHAQPRVAGATSPGDIAVPLGVASMSGYFKDKFLVMRRGQQVLRSLRLRTRAVDVRVWEGVFPPWCAVDRRNWGGSRC